MASDQNTDRVGTRLRLMSYNIQVAIASVKPHHYVTRSWRHVFPHETHFRNLNQIAEILEGHDIVGLQEVDAGSIRSSYVNQTQYLAERARFPFWTHQTNRRLGHIAKHSNGLLSSYTPISVEDHKLPGRVPGRGALVARFGQDDSQLIVVMIHLALGRKSRGIQLDYIAALVKEYEHVVVMGDMNCQPDSEELQSLLRQTGLGAPVWGLNTYPSWKPTRKLDHILVSSSLRIENVQVLPYTYSDHLPISMEVIVPASVSL
ncbi:MAG: endonuclease/exonuclease/phosphatase family protein [Gammaproteobacteria bacterium]|nr:endonuclease/exonuclease/phosphatase family protein [Gammaproteobacteria bacterium]